MTIEQRADVALPPRQDTPLASPLALKLLLEAPRDRGAHVRMLDGG
jgi:hypothetical protein